MPFFRSIYTFPRPRNVKSLRPTSCLRYASIESPPSLSYQEIDRKWRRIWSQNAADKPSSQSRTKPKSYVLPMFPYPSGSLHMGHLRVYTISDVLARYKRMRGFDVLHPMGWDAFGLPAENAANERGIDPAIWTEKNIATMKEQLIGMNGDFDWTREIRTCSSSFYRHTQKLFLMLHKRGLAYQAEALVNYDPIDKTVLANEQVDANGRSWRSGAVVEQVMLKQWFFRITAFKEALLDDLDVLASEGRWPERVILQQRNWLGRSTGATLKFAVQFAVNSTEKLSVTEPAYKEVEVFTTRPDTLFGVTYLAVSLNHPLVQQEARGSAALRDFLDQSKSLPPDSKVGFRLSNVTAANPISDSPATDTLPGINTSVLPVYAAPYVLDDYGTGAVMGVPAHDSRDLAFWRTQDSKRPVPQVVCPTGKEDSIELMPSADTLDEAYTGHGTLTSLCGAYAGLDSVEAARQIITDLKARSGSAAYVEKWRIRDWLVSRQRYWGTPIPIIHCDNCGAVPVPDNQLPVELPPLEKPRDGQLGNPLQNIQRWVNTICPSCGNSARRDTDTMDTFVDSSWYFMRFPDAENEKELVSQDVAMHMLPVDTYLGGVEHAILHLLYARFVYKFLASEGTVPRTDGEHALIAEPFRQLISQGMVHGKTFSDPLTGRFLRPDEVEGPETPEPIIKATGGVPAITWEKMSKSKYNGVDPLDCMNRYGTDAVRAHILFAAPITEILDWDEGKIIGIQRWFHRVQRLVDVTRRTLETLHLDSADVGNSHSIFAGTDTHTFLQSLNDEEVDMFLLIHQSIVSITQTLEKNIYALNTSVSDLIKLTNGLLIDLPEGNRERNSAASEHAESTVRPIIIYYGVSALLRMLGPMAPAFAEQCWEGLHTDQLNGDGVVASIFDCAWPESILDTSLAASLTQRRKTMTCAVQVNGKLRFTLDVPVASLGATSTSKQQVARDDMLVEKLLESDQGRYWLTEKNDWEKRKKIIVVHGGKLVNVVF